MQKVNTSKANPTQPQPFYLYRWTTYSSSLYQVFFYGLLEYIYIYIDTTYIILWMSLFFVFIFWSNLTSNISPIALLFLFGWICDELRLSVEFVTVRFLGICRHSCCDWFPVSWRVDEDTPERGTPIIERWKTYQLELRPVLLGSPSPVVTRQFIRLPVTDRKG